MEEGDSNVQDIKHRSRLRSFDLHTKVQLKQQFHSLHRKNMRTQSRG